MKDLNLIVWLTQLGLSVAVPLAGFILLAVWLHNSCGWGEWVIWAGVVLGIVSAVDGFRASLKILGSLSKTDDRPDEPPVSFNDHD